MSHPQLSRRELLSASMVLGATIAVSPFSRALSKVQNKYSWNKSASTQILRLGPVPAEFDSGIRMALGSEGQSQEIEFTDLDKMTSHMAQSSNSIIIGLMSTAAFTNFNDNLRVRRADLICSGIHVSGKNFSRHQFETTSQSRGMASAFAKILSQCGENSLVSEISLQETLSSSVTLPTVKTPQFTSWEQGLGYQLTRAASGHWRPTQGPGSIVVGMNSSSSVNYSSVTSFIVRI
jgi:hypothetical protein